MSLPLFIPPFLRFSRVCERCGQWTPKRIPECKHCEGLDDAELERLKQRRAERGESNAHLGRVFLWIAACLALALLAMWTFSR